MQPATGPIGAVVLSADGRLVASAAGDKVRVANTADGVVTAEITATGIVTALAVDLAARGLAIGVASGMVTLAPLVPGVATFGVSVDTAVTALAFQPDGERLAVGTVAGSIRLLRASDGGAVGMPRTFLQAVRWLDFTVDGGALLLATDGWLHSLSPTLEPVQSRFLPGRGVASAFAPISATQLRFASVNAAGVPRVTLLDLAAAPPAVTAEARGLLRDRDWAVALALRLDDAGEPMPFDP
jgi:hypothetical protein